MGISVVLQKLEMHLSHMTTSFKKNLIDYTLHKSGIYLMCSHG